MHHPFPRIISTGSQSLVRFSVLILLDISFELIDARHSVLLLLTSWMASVTVGTDFNHQHENLV